MLIYNYLEPANNIVGLDLKKLNNKPTIENAFIKKLITSRLKIRKTHEFRIILCCLQTYWNIPFDNYILDNGQHNYYLLDTLELS